MPTTDQSDRRPRVWDPDALRDPHGQPDKAQRVAAMFDAIAGTYERVNTVTSFGRDAAWRRCAVAAARVRPGDVVLDVCCGTGDMLRAFARAGPRLGALIGVDFARGMLSQFACDGPCPKDGQSARAIGGLLGGLRRPRAADATAGSGDRPRRAPVRLLRADALRLPVADASVDVISCAFGVRNFRDLQAGFDEMARVTRPGARVVILEFATPGNPLGRRIYRLYCEVFLPRMAAWISSDTGGAYRYLARSIHTFETSEALVRRLEAAGFADVTLRRLNLGGVVLYRGVRR